MREDSEKIRGGPEETIASEDRLRSAEAASGIGTFDMDLPTGTWQWGPQMVALFGVDPCDGSESFEACWLFEIDFGK